VIVFLMEKLIEELQWLAFTKVDTSFTFMCIVDNIRILGW